MAKSLTDWFKKKRKDFGEDFSEQARKWSNILTPPKTDPATRTIKAQAPKFEVPKIDWSQAPKLKVNLGKELDKRLRQSKLLKRAKSVYNYLELDRPLFNPTGNKIVDELFIGPTRNLRGLYNLFNVSSHFVGGALKEAREQPFEDKGVWSQRDYAQRLGRAGLESTRKKESFIMEELPKRYGQDPYSLPGLAIGLAGEVILGPDPADALVAAKYSKVLTKYSDEALEVVAKYTKVEDWLKTLKSEDIIKLSNEFGSPENFFNLAKARFMRLTKAVNPGLKDFEKGVNVPKGADDSLKGARKSFEDWVNQRRTTPISGRIKKLEFEEFDEKGMQGILDFQKEKKGLFADVRKYFDTKYYELQREGVRFSYKKNYLPQLWVDDAEDVERVFGRRLTQKPGFSLTQTIADYETGIEKGLTPRYTTISELTASYEEMANKALADKGFFDFLRKQEFILPTPEAPKSWKTLDPDNFPSWTIKMEDKLYEGSFKAEPELADLINNYLKEPSGPVSKFSAIATRVKNIGLGGGIPGTSLNYHGLVNIYRRDLMAASNPLNVLFRDLKWIVKPSTADDYVKASLKDLEYFSRKGLTVTTEDWNKYRRAIPEGKIEKFESGWNKLMGDPLFTKTLPAMKISFAKKTRNQLLEDGLSETVAAEKASEIANNIFGGINLDAIGRNKETQNLLRAAFLAPDWYETTLKTGKGVIKGIINPKNVEYKTYRTILRNIVFYYIVENVINKVLSGHYMFENEGFTNKFYIDSGTYTSDGKKRYYTPWGTGVDFIKIPVQIVGNIIEGRHPIEALTRPVLSRLSMPVSSALHLALNEDYRGRELYGKDKWGRDIPLSQEVINVSTELMSGLGLPPPAKAAAGLISGKIGTVEQAVAESIEAPIRYKSQVWGEAEKKKFETMKQVGVEPEAAVERLKAQREPKESTWFSELFFKKRGVKTAEGYTRDPLLVAVDKEAKLNKETERVKEIFETGLTREEIEETLAAENLGNFAEASIIIIKNLGVKNGSRPDYLKGLLEGLSNEDYQETVLFLAEKSVLTDPVVDHWFNTDQISENQKKVLKQMIKFAKGKTSAYRDGTISRKLKKVKSPSYRTVKISVPKRSKRMPILKPKRLEIDPLISPEKKTYEMNVKI